VEIQKSPCGNSLKGIMESSNQSPDPPEESKSERSTQKCIRRVKQTLGKRAKVILFVPKTPRAHGQEIKVCGVRVSPIYGERGTVIWFGDQQADNSLEVCAKLSKKHVKRMFLF
jgi:hypothetical protein